MLADNLVSLTVVGGTFEMLNGPNPPIVIGGDKAVIFIGSAFNLDGTKVPEVFHFLGARTKAVIVISPAQWQPSNVPWSATMHAVTVFDAGHLTGLQGLSGSYLPRAEPRGHSLGRRHCGQPGDA